MDVRKKLSSGDIVFCTSRLNVAPEAYSRSVRLGSSMTPVQ